MLQKITLIGAGKVGATRGPVKILAALGYKIKRIGSVYK